MEHGEWGRLLAKRNLATGEECKATQTATAIQGKLETSSSAPPPWMGKKPTQRTAGSVASLLVPIVQTTYGPNKELVELSGSIIAITTPPTGRRTRVSTSMSARS